MNDYLNEQQEYFHDILRRVGRKDVTRQEELKEELKEGLKEGFKKGFIEGYKEGYILGKTRGEISPKELLENLILEED